MIQAFVAFIALAVSIGSVLFPLNLKNTIVDIQDEVYSINEQLIQNQNLGVASEFVGGASYYLSGSGVSGSDTSITLTSLTIPQSGYELTDSDFSSTFYLTFEPGSRTRQEFASCTTVTQNANNSATLSGCSRGLLPFEPYTASSTYQFAHAGGTVMVFSNSPAFYNQFPTKANDETITGQWTFNSFPITPTSTYASTTVAGVVYMSTTPASSTNPIAVGDNDTRVPTQSENDALVGAAGSPSSSNKFTEQSYVDAKTWTSLSQNFTAGESLVATSTPVAVYASSTDGKVYKLDSDNKYVWDFVGFLGTTTTSYASGSTTPIIVSGIVGGFTGLSTSTNYFATSTAGNISITADPTRAYKISKAVSNTQILIEKGRKKLRFSDAVATTTVTVALEFPASELFITTYGDTTNDRTAMGMYDVSSGYWHSLDGQYGALAETSLQTITTNGKIYDDGDGNTATLSGFTNSQFTITKGGAFTNVNIAGMIYGY